MSALKRLLLFLIIAMSFTQCKVLQSGSNPNPSANAAILDDVTNVGKQVDAMYLLMEQSIDKTFDTYLTDYLNGEVLINSIISRNEARPKSAFILRQAQAVRELFLKYKAEHKVKGTLNDSEIRAYRRYMNDILKPLLKSEMSLK